MATYIYGKYRVVVGYGSGRFSGTHTENSLFVPDDSVCGNDTKCITRELQHTTPNQVLTMSACAILEHFTVLFQPMLWLGCLCIHSNTLCWKPGDITDVYSHGKNGSSCGVLGPWMNLFHLVS